MGDAPRIPPIPPTDWPPAMGDALAALEPPVRRHVAPPRDPARPKGLNVLGTLAHHPELTRAFHTLTGHVLFATTISPRQRELLVLRVAAVRDCAYEWAQHLVLAADAGITDEEVARLRVGPAAPGWTGIDGALVAAVDELLHDARLTDATWGALAAELDTQQLMDVVFTVGTYDTLAMAMRSFGTELDADLRKPSSP